MKKPRTATGNISQLDDAVATQIGKTSSQRADTKEKTYDELLRDVQVHQLELKMQNDELRSTHVALEEARDKYLSLYDFSPVGYFTLTPNTMIEEVNLIGAALLGVDRKHLLNRGFGNFVAPEDIDRFRLHVIGVLKQRGKQGCDLALKRADGTPFHARLESIHVDRCDSTSALRTAMIDITERKRLEEMLRNSNEELERHVKERTAELSRSNAQLELSNLELRRFAYIASHDLQSPLRAICGFVQLLRRNYEGKFDEQADFWIRRVIESTKEMHSLIQDLLSYSSIDSAGRIHKLTDLHAVFDDAVRSLEAAIREQGATVTCDDDLPAVNGDRSQLVQLLKNLIGNGIKYHGDDPPQIHLSAEMDGSKWVFSIHDNGIGIDPKHRERVFDIFHRLHTKEKYPGTGIGLAICRRVVQQHDGSIWVESQPGKGSVFHFTLGNRGRTDQ